MFKIYLRRLLPLFLLDFYHFFWALVGAVLYRFPSKELAVIGVTGTNGKSTVVEMCELVLREAGYRVASFSSIRFRIGDREWRNELKMTMPGRFRLQKFLRQAVDAGCQYAVLEVTSEGIKQHRHRFIDFDVAVITNLTPEHIEAHGSFERYKQAKGELFRALKSEIRNPKPETNSKFLSPRIGDSERRERFIITNPKPRTRTFGSVRGGQIPNYKFKIQNKKVSIVNLDDESAEYFLGFAADGKYGYKVQNEKCKMQNYNSEFKILEATAVSLSSNGLQFSVAGTVFNLPLLGKFNVYNALAAICVGLSQGIDLETIKNALEKMQGVPGRMEIILREPFTVIVDYAHTPDALIKVYESIRNYKFQITNHKQITNSKSQITNKSKLICVLGAAGGGRDKWKRSEFGKIAAKYCDRIILTNEDPYDENPLSILEQIESGFSQIRNSKFEIRNYNRILDRREAIRKALTLAQPGDAVIITGKGSEPWMCVAGGKKIPWDDRQIVLEQIGQLQRAD